MRKKIVSLGIVIWLSVSPLQAFVDVPNLIQNTITAVQEVYSYSKTVQDWIKTASYYLDNLDNLGDQLIAQTGIKDAIGLYNDISKMYSEYSNLYKSMDEFKEGILKDPKGFIEEKLKNKYKKYQLFNRCENLKGDELNICLRETITYAFAYDELDTSTKRINELKSQANELESKKKTGETENIKEAQDRANQLTQIQLEYQQLQLKLLQDLQRLQIQQKELEDQKQQIMAKNVSIKTDSTWLKAPTNY